MAGLGGNAGASGAAGKLKAMQNTCDPMGLRARTVTDGEESRFIFSGWNIVGQTDGNDKLQVREIRGDGLNLYSYVQNNPVMWVDPSGYAGKDCTPSVDKSDTGNVTENDLYAFGNRSNPRSARAENDFDLESPSSVINSQKPPLPAGASTTLDVDTVPLTGHYHMLPSGTVLPSGLGVVADGSGIVPNSPHNAGHHTIYPTADMTVDNFNDLFQSLPWQYGGKK